MVDEEMKSNSQQLTRLSIHLFNLVDWPLERLSGRRYRHKMPTSELTDALNPFIGQQRQPHYPSDQHTYPSQPFQTSPPHSFFTPHRSELEYAVSEPPPPPRYGIIFLSLES
jgi:hypothetical protein